MVSKPPVDVRELESPADASALFDERPGPWLDDAPERDLLDDDGEGVGRVDPSLPSIGSGSFSPESSLALRPELD
jgi:hypothetical protein